MRFVRHEGEDGKAGLPLTSLIDVVFLLLIFFMVTSVLSPSESQLAAALKTESRRTSSAADFQPQVVVVDVREGSSVFVMGDRVMRTKGELRGLLEQLPKESGVFVKGEAVAPVEAVAAALQACRDSGFTRITYVPGR